MSNDDTPATVPADERGARLSKRLQEIATKLDRALEQAAGGTVLFSLIVWSNQAGARTQYVANVARNDAVKALEQTLERWKSEMPDVPLHEVH